MRRILWHALACCCTTAFMYLPALSLDEATHLLVRTGYAPTKAEIDALIRLDREAAVSSLLEAATANKKIVSPPSWTSTDLGTHYRSYKAEETAWRLLSEPERRKKWDARRKVHRERGRELKAWLCEQMVSTKTPIVERMAQFWHNHFTTELRVVEDPVLVWAQHQLVREQALGNFGILSLKMPLDPAMWRYLDSNSNVKGRPNENFAREVMELFTVGEGNYTEKDIQEAARAFTGYKINPQTGRPEKAKDKHDHAVKRVLGHRGNFDSDEILKVLLLKESDVALHVAEKIWREFISPEPDKKGVWYIAKAFYKGRYHVKPLLKATLLSDAFWAAENRGSLIKSPFELVVGAHRQLGSQQGGKELHGFVRKLGQDPFDPPNVKGWHGHSAWISTQSFIARQEVLAQLIHKRDTSSDHWLGRLLAKGDSGKLNAASMLSPIPFAKDQLLATSDPLPLLMNSSHYHIK